MHTRCDRAPFMILAVVGINALVMGMTYGVAMDGEDWMAYGAYFFLGVEVLAALFSVGYLISHILKKTKIMFSLSFSLSLICFCLTFLYASICNLINNYVWLGSLIIAVVFIMVLLIWNIWIGRCVWKDIKAGCYSDSGKEVPHRMDNLIVCIALVPLIPFMGSIVLRQHMGDILGYEIGSIFMVYGVVVVSMLLSKFIFKFIVYIVCCIRGKN